jgi:hypothetical protein
MALLCKVIEFAQPTSSGNQATTGAGFRPKAIMIFGSAPTSAGNAVNLFLNAGMATSTSARGVISSFDTDAVATTIVFRGTRTDRCYASYASATSIVEADLVSLDADGFTLNWSKVEASNARKLFAVCLGGDDLTNAKVQTFTGASSAGNQSVTGVGFQPDCTIFFAGLTLANLGESSMLFSIGAAKSSSERVAAGMSSVDNVGTSNTNRKQVSDKCITLPWAGTGAVLQEADFVSHDADGFTINWTTALSNRTILALCLKGGQYKIGAETQKTSTGTKATTGTSFTPTGLLTWGVNNTASSSIADNARLSIGFASGAGDEKSIWGGSLDNQGTSVSDSRYSATKVIEHCTEGTPTVNAAADVDSFDSNGFTLDWTTADATAREFLYLAFGSDAAPPGGFIDNTNIILRHILGAA